MGPALALVIALSPSIFAAEPVTWRSMAEAVDEIAFLDEPRWLRRDRTRDPGDFTEHLETDRDSFTPAATVVGAGWTLVETSYSFLDNRRTPESHSFPELLTRVGITERTEIRIGWNYEAGGGGDVSGLDAANDVETATVTTEAQMLFGFKSVLHEQQGWRPEGAVIMEAFTPTAGPENNTDIIASYVVGWTFLDDWKLDAAMRYGTENQEGDHFNQWAPSVVLRVPVHERWNLHAEYFGVMSQNAARDTSIHYFSPGVHYLISPDLEIGIRTGWGLSQDAANFFSNVGLGVRF